MNGVGTYTKPKRFGRIQITKMVDGEERVYLDRIYLFRCRWFSVRLHRILLPDLDRDPHDHPWWFVAIPLRGAYTEQWGRQGQRHLPRLRLVKLLSVHRPTDLHQIRRLHIGRDGVPVTTLFITGPETRAWGFHTEEGWVPWQQYVEAKEDAVPDRLGWKSAP